MSITRRRFSTLLAGSALQVIADMPLWAADGSSDVSSLKVGALVRAMTLDEKVALITGTHDPDYRGQSGYAPGVPRLHVPAMRWANGPSGIEAQADATAPPQALALAATFDVEAARRFGQLIGLEARALGMDVINGPQLDIARLPNWGRNVTALGEDPFLSGRMGAAEIQGIQEQGVLATAKHYIGYTQAEHIRGPDAYNFVIDPRTLREIYLPGFEAAARVGVASFLAAHVTVNGKPDSENAANLTGILRDELGWGGYVVSDWNATVSSNALTAGLDVEMPGYGIQGGAQRPYYFGNHLAAEIRTGRIPEAALDRAVSRLLGQMERFGFLDGTRVKRPRTIDIEADARIVRELALEAAVLLKNDGILPLREADLSSVVLIGPTARQLAVGPGDGRAVGFEAREISPLEAMRRTINGASEVGYAIGDDLTGLAIPGSVLTPASGQGRGLTRTLKDGTTSVDATLDFVGPKALPAKTSYRWTGTLAAPTSGDYLLMIQSWGGSAILSVDGQQRASSAKVPFHGFPRKWTSLLPTTDGLDNGQTTVSLEAGRNYSLDIEALGDTPSPVQIRLAWITPEMRQANVSAAVSAARAARTAIIFSWDRSGELVMAGNSLALPGEQDALIEAVATANPNTIVVLNTGGPVTMPWLGRVRGVLEMWYPGQEGGWATADLLLGRANPSGKLPITFPARWEDTPAGDPKHPERYVGVNREIIYSEGVFVGYRHYDQAGIEPLFPFGYGLSYTHFAYSNLTVARAKDGAEVNFVVRNMGTRAGAEVPQIYVGPGMAEVPMAPKSLAGFARIVLAPGQAKTVRIHVPARQLSYWSKDHRGWVIPGGNREIYVGASSRDIRLTGRLLGRASL